MYTTFAEIAVDRRKEVVDLVRENPDLAHVFFSHITETVSVGRRRTKGRPVSEVMPQYEYNGRKCYIGKQLQEVLGQKLSHIAGDHGEVSSLFEKGNPLVGRKILEDMGVPPQYHPLTTTSIVYVDKAVWYAMYQGTADGLYKAMSAVVNGSRSIPIATAEPAPIVVAESTAIETSLPVEGVVETTLSEPQFSIQIPNIAELVGGQVSAAVAEAIQQNQTAADVDMKIPFSVSGEVDLTVRIHNIRIGNA